MSSPDAAAIRPSSHSFDLRSLTYITHVDDNLCCPICQSPLVDPFTTSCRHTFCLACITDALKVSKSCPVDRSPLDTADIKMAPVVLANLVNDLTVLCPNHALGCSATLSRGNVEGHLKEDCQYVTVDCPGCGEKIMRKDRQGDSEDCVHVEEACRYCSEKHRKLDMKSHEAVCSAFTSSCRHCGIECPLSKILAHEATCDEAIVNCDSASVGCPWHGPRKESTTHSVSCPLTHLRPLLEEHNSRIANLERENKLLRRRLEASLTARAQTDIIQSNTTTALDNQTLRVLTEQERIRSDMERLYVSMQELDMKQNTLAMFMGENMRTQEEVAMIGAAVNNLQTQLHGLQLLTIRRQGMDQNGAGNRSDGPSSQVKRAAENGVLGRAGRECFSDMFETRD
ncbi:hypothetical protein EX30DRAFT_305645 [Ascodesmis nigricans]|uniref:RING-type domain-containing protein n=1 Tax=Ascodesmis nigricans TaxID=341454 RepID=A0A4S2MYQ5_9PEZI|nr:hypothetical protein EX30DRAFT_305645 [Ascodesmis nigricans]